MARRRRTAATQEQAPAADEGPGFYARLREAVSLPTLESWSTTLRTVMLNALFLGAFVLLLPVLIGQFRRDQVIIEPIAVPEALAAYGLTLDANGTELVFTYDANIEQTSIATLLRDMERAGISVKDLHTTQSSLEDIFVSLVHRKEG